MISTHTSIKCGHFRKTGAGAILESYEIFSSDHRITGLPLNLKFNTVHVCDILSVYQEHRGINRWFIVRDASIIQK
jgi:hypothetical protein